MEDWIVGYGKTGSSLDCPGRECKFPMTLWILGGYGNAKSW